MSLRPAAARDAQAPTLHAAISCRMGRCLHAMRVALAKMQPDLDPLLSGMLGTCSPLYVDGHRWPILQASRSVMSCCCSGCIRPTLSGAASAAVLTVLWATHPPVVVFRPCAPAQRHNQSSLM